MKMTNNKIIAGLKETQEVILMAVALAQLTRKVKEVVEKEEEFNWFSFLTSFPGLLPAIVTALSTVKEGVEGIEEVTIEFSKMTPEQQVQLKEWAKTQVPDLKDDKVEQFIKDCFAVVIDIWMLIKYFLPVQSVSENGTNTEPQV